MRTQFAADEAAALFALYSQPIPPNVAEHVSEPDVKRRLRALDRVLDSLVSSGALVVDAEGQLSLARDLSSVLQTCFAADAAVAVDIEGSPGPVFYRLRDEVVVVAVSETGVEIRRIDGVGEADSLLSQAIGASSGVESEKRSLFMTLEQLDRVLGLFYKGRTAGLEALAVQSGLDQAVLSDVLDHVVLGATVRISTLRPGSEDEIDTRICVSGSTCWLLKCAMVANAAYALLMRGPAEGLFHLVSEFAPPGSVD